MRNQIHLTLTENIERNDQEIEVTINATYTPEVRSRSYDPPTYEGLDIDEVLDENEQPVELTAEELRKFGAKLLDMGREEARCARC